MIWSKDVWKHLAKYMFELNDKDIEYLKKKRIGSLTYFKYLPTVNKIASQLNINHGILQEIEFFGKDFIVN